MNYALSTSGVRIAISLYANDTLVLCSAKTVEIAQSNINFFLDYVLRRIENLSLEVAAEKTEAVLFRGTKRLAYTNPTVRIRNSLVRVSPSMIRNT